MLLCITQGMTTRDIGIGICTNVPYDLGRQFSNDMNEYSRKILFFFSDWLCQQLPC